MASAVDDVKNHRLHHEMQHKIVEINRVHITEIAGDIKRGNFMECAELVARLRGEYLAAVLRLAGDKSATSAQAALRLRDLREAYTEAREGFSAVEHALKRGYFDLRD
ncbi:MAG: hypothetical protein AAF384_16710 [Pseudomonadota bacterium]